MKHLELVNSAKVREHLAHADKLAIKKLQKSLVLLGQCSIAVDGLFGKASVRAINNVNETRLLKYLGKSSPVATKAVVEQPRNDDDDSTKSVIMNFLAENEGTYTHWNHSETNFTTAYGIYAKSFPKSKPVKLIKKIAKRNGIPLTRANIKKVDAALTSDDRTKLYNLVYDFYCANFLNPKISKHLGPKSALALFSNSVNGGKSRGYKALQSALGVGVDGKWGSGSQRALENTRYSDDELNQRQGDYMFRFYNQLARKPKFARFLKGWTNRIKNLGWHK